VVYEIQTLPGFAPFFFMRVMSVAYCMASFSSFSWNPLIISGEIAPGATRDITVRFHVVLHLLHLYINHTSKLFFCAFTRNIPDEANPVLALHFLQYLTTVGALDICATLFAFFNYHSPSCIEHFKQEGYKRGAVPKVSSHT